MEDLSRYEMQDGKIRVQYLLANQSDTDGRMLLRRAGYVGAVYREQYDGKAINEFPVISLLLYWGRGHWGKVRSLREYFEDRRIPDELCRLIDDSRLPVFEMRNLPPHVREKLEEMNVKEEDEITMCELFDQYTRRGRTEGIKEGIREGIKEGIKALISTCRELGVSFDETAAKVREKFSLGEEETRKNMQLYW